VMFITSACDGSESHASSQRERRFALYAEFGLMYRVMVLLDLLIGMRCGELLVLQWRDFDFAKKTVKIHKAICHQHVGPVETRESERVVPLDDDMIAGPLACRTQSKYAKDTD
jgi:integrase